MFLQDGTGSGNLAAVNSDKKLVVKAATAIQEATLKGEAYAWTAVTADIDAGDTALCVVNRSHTKLLVISKIYLYADVATIIKVHVPAPATWAGTAVVGVNLNRTQSAKLADAVAYADESGATFAETNVIASLHTNEVGTDEFALEYPFDDSLILGYDDAVAADIISEPAAFNCTIVGYYIDA